MKDNDLSSTSINTGIVYLQLPEKQFQLIKPQQSLDYESQIELHFHPFTDEDFHHLNPTDAQRYKTSYENLHRQVRQSIMKVIDLNEEILQIKHSIKYNNEVFPILLHNHKLAKREKKILYQILTTTWQRFDERMHDEITIQNQLEQTRKEHQYFFKMKIQQEQYLKYSLDIDQIHNQIIDFKHEIQQLSDYKRQLTIEVQEKENQCRHYLIQLDHLKSTLIRHYLTELNGLQLERDSLITQIELIKYNLFEQMQENDQIIRNYRQSLHSFRLTIHELEQQLKQQTDLEFHHLQISNGFPRQTIFNETERLISILETKIDEKKTHQHQLEKTFEQFHEKILQEKHSLFKKEKDLQSMEQLDQQLNSNIRICREIYLQLKTDRRTIERQLNLKLKEFTTDDRLCHTLLQQYDSLLARKRIEQLRLQTSHDQRSPLMDENLRLQIYTDQLHQRYIQINPEHLLQFQEQITQLKDIHRTSREEMIHNEMIVKNCRTIDEQYQRKLNRITLRMKTTLEKCHDNHQSSRDNSEHIQMIENQLNEQQHFYLEENARFKQMKLRLDNRHNKRIHLNKQMQIASNNLQQFHYRLQIFNEQILFAHKDFVEYEISLKALREFHTVLKQQDQNNLNRLTRISLQLIDRQKQYKISQISLREIHEELIQLKQMRSMFVRMVVRRGNLSRLLYQKLTRSDRDIHRYEKNIQMINQCIKSYINQIRQIRNENKKILQRKEQNQFETIKAHANRLLDHSHQKQQALIEQIFQRHYSIDRIPIEDMSSLLKKYNRLKTRLTKMITRGMIGNLILLTIQQEFIHRLKVYRNRETENQFNDVRANLRHLSRKLKWKSAELNMLIDYQYHFEWIHTDMIVDYRCH